MDHKFSMADTQSFSEELAAEIGLVWDEVTEVNVLTAQQWLISSLRIVCNAEVIDNLLSKTFADYCDNEQFGNIAKFQVIVDCSRHDCFAGDPRFNQDDHTFYDDAVGFVYDGHDLIPQFVNNAGQPVLLDPNSGEENMPNLLDIILAALQQDTSKPQIVVEEFSSTVRGLTKPIIDQVTGYMKGVEG